MENNCGYHLFESDSEEEEEEVTEKKEVEEPPKKKTAFQVGGQQQNKIQAGLRFSSSRDFTAKLDVNGTNRAHVFVSWRTMPGLPAPRQL